MNWQIQPQRFLNLNHHALIMGIVNVTPDSFSDGGHYWETDAAIAHGIAQWKAGAQILDIGGESTRPGAPVVSASEERDRVLPVILGLRAAIPEVILSIDTMKAEVARAALAAGVEIINDVTGLTGDPEMPALAASSGCGVVIMHMQGTPRTMQSAPHYTDVVKEVQAFFRQRLMALEAVGIKRQQMVFDPGIGFGKTLQHNLALLHQLVTLAPEERPLLLGVSRKSFIAGVLGDPNPALRAWPTVALTAYAREAGARILRVHDAGSNAEALCMTEAILGITPS